MTNHVMDKGGSQPETGRRTIATGIAGLDMLLEGGILAGGIYLVQGHPGTGKTILGNQICFNHAARGGKALFVTLLAESHSRMLMHLGSLRFFDAAEIPQKIYYISAFTELEQSGLAGLLRLLRKETLSHGAQILILDGLVAAGSSATSGIELKKFIHELQVQAATLDCSMFLLTIADTSNAPAEHTMVDGVVDGVIELSHRLYGWRTERDLRVLKRRGAGFIAGLHAFRITDVGITVYPRIEALPLTPEQVRSSAPLPTGLRQLDRMMGGGIPACSATLLLGAAGIGKTTLGLQFLSQCGPEQRGLFYGFYETPAALRAKAVALNLTAAELMDSGDIEVLWSPATEGSIDEVCARLLDAVRRSQVRRLFIDGLEALQKLATDPTRVSHILAALMAQLQRLGVSTVYTAETDTLVGETGPLAGVSMRGASSIVENVLSMRFANAGAHVYRMIAVIKVRDGHIDSRIRTFDIGDQGLKIDESHEHADEILSHEVQPRRASPSSRPSTGTSSNLPGD